MGLPLNIDLQQILLHMLNFVLLFGGLYFILYKPVKKFMDSRASRYAEKEAETERKLREAEEAKAEYEEKLRNAEAEIAAMKSEAAEQAAADAQAEHSRALQDADGIRRAAEAEGEAEKQRLIRQANREISEIAAQAAEKAVFGSPEEAFDSFLDSAERSDGE